MITVDVRADLSQITKYLTSVQREQIPFATAYALTQTAEAARKEVDREIPRVFDRPTPYTQKATFKKAATKRKLEAQVFIKDYSGKGVPAVKYLEPEIKGGPRGMKGFEKLLQKYGKMPDGWYAVPTKYARLDGYGNVPLGTINAILSQLQARTYADVLKNETEKDKKRRNSVKYRGKRVLSRYFAVQPGQARTKHLAPGIWERTNLGSFVGPTQNAQGSIRPIMIYTQRRPTYRPRLKFFEIVKRTSDIQLPLQFKRGFVMAMRTARPAGGSGGGISVVNGVVNVTM